PRVPALAKPLTQQLTLSLGAADPCGAGIKPISPFILVSQCGRQSRRLPLADEVGLNQFSLCCDRIGRDLELELKRAGRCLPLAPGRGESRGGLCCPRS